MQGGGLAPLAVEIIPIQPLGRCFRPRWLYPVMAHAVVRTFQDSASELLGVPQVHTSTERLDMEVANLLASRKEISLTGLAAAMRQRIEWGTGLGRTIIALGLVRPIDYHRA